MWHDIAAEATKQVRRPAHWLLLAVGAALTLSFGYLVPYVSYTGETRHRPGALEFLLPAHFPDVSVGGTPVFTGCLTLIFGALVVGSEYHWETWKTVLSQRSGRLSVFGAKLVVLVVGSAGFLLALYAVSAVASVAVAQREGASMSWPAFPDALGTFAGGTLICATWACFGAVLAVLLRSVATPIGLGLVWMLAVQNLLTNLAAPAIGWVDSMQKGLPGPNAGSLAASLGANPDAPGIDQLVPSGQATLVLVVYLLAFGLLGGLLFARRDIT